MCVCVCVWVWVMYDQRLSSAELEGSSCDYCLRFIPDSPQQHCSDSASLTLSPSLSLFLSHTHTDTHPHTPSLSPTCVCVCLSFSFYVYERKSVKCVVIMMAERENHKLCFTFTLVPCRRRDTHIPAYSAFLHFSEPGERGREREVERERERKRAVERMREVERERESE